LPITFPDLPAANHFAKIVELSPVIDPSSGTIEVLAEGHRPARRPSAGMTVESALPACDETSRARLDVALPEIPARTLSQRPPRLDPKATFPNM